MLTVIRSGRFYFWPIITANVLAMSLAIDGELIDAMMFSVVISCLSSFGFLLNDIWDQDVDRVNKAGHFEYANTITVVIGVSASLFFLLIGLFLAFWLGPAEFGIACTIAFFLGIYTVLLRKYLLMPTIIAALLASSPLWAPLVLWPNNVGVLKVMFVIAIIIILSAREVLMDTRDRLGDLSGGRDTFATVFGNRIAKLIAVILTLSASILLTAVAFVAVLNLPMGKKIIVFALVGSILYLLLRSGLGALLHTDKERLAIQTFVIRSRWAMGLIPLLIYTLWHL